MSSRCKEKTKAVSQMTMAEVKEYLKMRGVSVNGYLKPALLEIAQAVEKMMLPIDPNHDNVNEMNANKIYIINDTVVERPLSYPVVNNFSSSPPFGLYDIFNYLIYHSTEYDKQGLAAYKSFDDYRLFDEGYVESLETALIDGYMHLFVAKVRPAMKEKTDDGKKFYDIWFVLEGKGINRGSVLMARCTCKGGLDGGCKHIAASMYSLEDLLNNRGSVTSGPCQWLKRATAETKPCDIKELKIRRSEQTYKRKYEHYYLEHIDVDVRHEDDRHTPSKNSLESFTEAVSSVSRKPCILPLLQKMYTPSLSQKRTNLGRTEHSGKQTLEETKEFLDDNVNTDSGFLTAKLLQYHKKHNLHKIISAEHLLANIALSDEEVENVSTATCEQWKSKQWYQERAGVITASKAKRVFNAQIKLEKNSKSSIINLVKDIISPKCSYGKRPMISVNPQNAREWGLVHEDSARKSYCKVESKKHYKLSLVSKGLLICKAKPMIGASVDNIRTCQCGVKCPEIVVEYKCPWKHRNLSAKEAFLTPEIGGTCEGDTFMLKKTSSYYFQVQLQMFVCGQKSCDFVVWTEKGIFVVHVPFDEEFVSTLCQKIESFWFAEILPSIIHDLTNRHCETCTVIDKSCQKNLIADNHPNTLPVANHHLHSVHVSGIDIYETCIKGLDPKQMINDNNIVNLLLSGIKDCPIPIISSFFYTVLCGEQENNLFRKSRNERAEIFFTPELWTEDFLFIPINRSYHWLLAVVTPWHVLIMDSLTRDICNRKREFSLLFRFFEHFTQKFLLSKKHLNLSNKVLKVPQQEFDSNNCGIYIALFAEHFVQELGSYINDREEYCKREHK